MSTTRIHRIADLDRTSRLRLAVAAVVDPRTIVRIYRGERVQSTSRARIAEAAARLGYPPPPAPDAVNNEGAEGVLSKNEAALTE